MPALEGVDETTLDPELLAEALNQQFGQLEAPEVGKAWDMAHCLGPGDLPHAGAPGSEAPPAELAYRKLAAFAGKLSPGLRRQFLNSTFDIKKIKSGGEAEGIIRQLSADVVIDTLEDINQNQISVPPLILGLLQSMSRHASPGEPPAGPEITDRELHEKMRTIFKEHAMEDFIPDSYQGKLHRMMSADQVPLLGLEGVHDLLDTFEAASMEKKTSDILLLLLRSGDTTEEGYAALSKSLIDICTFFLQTGDYRQLSKILRQLGADALPAGRPHELLELFVRREFLDELLAGLRTWGKAKFDEIGELIREIGAPSIEVLLDRLADAESMSLRRFIMELLIEFGPVAGPAIIERLSDGRWYFLRNIIGMIRQLELASSVERLRPLVRHRDGRVCQEALRALLQFHDPEAESSIARDLEGENRELLLAAIRMAGKSGSAALLSKLHALMAGPGLSGKEHEVKSAVVQSLGEIANPESLPVLEAVLASRSLFHPRLLKRLKIDIVATLGRYPAGATRPILARIAQGRGSLAGPAALQLRGGGRPS